jgi:M6 family metalloprotease-like protein
MNTNHRLSIFTGILIILGLLLSLAASTASAQEGVVGQTWSQSGWFSITWGDSTGGTSQAAYTLTDNSGQTTVLLIDERLAQSLGGVLSFNRKYVSVQGVWAAPLSAQGTSTVLNVTSISLVRGTEAPDGAALGAVTGSNPWVSIMCKYSDFAAEPENQAFFLGMYANTWPGMDHYWRELSYNTANVAGSAAAGWFTLPQPKSYYVYDMDSDGDEESDRTRLVNDCTSVADPSVNFSLYMGINMMFNANLDCSGGFCWAWGGSRTLTLDGVTKVWSTTWEPPWAYADISVIQHEMGHGFGLPHSSGAYGATYDNVWDVMSNDRYNCAAATDPTYGCAAQHTISYHKDKLGWIPAGQKVTVGVGTFSTITLEQLALPTNTNPKMAQIPIGGSGTHFYTVEARRLTGYDVKLPGNAVIIHEVDTTRGIPAHVIDVDLNGDTSDAGAMWTVGESFFDATNNISVSVISATASGFQVLIVNGIADITPPVVTVPANMTVEATGPGGRVVSFTATATDAVAPPNPVVTCALPSGSTFPLGLNTVTCSATDAAGNTGTNSFTINVHDTTPPVVTVPANMIVEATGPTGRVVSFSATATDIVAPLNPVVTCVPPSGSTFPLGVTTVNCSATDTAGNTGTNSFTIQVRDTTPPTLTLPANMTVTAINPAGAVVTFSATATDTVAPLNPVVTCVPPSGSTFPLGVTTVNCSASDTAGNTANGFFTISVVPSITIAQSLKMPTFDKMIVPIPWKVKWPTIPFASVRDCTVSLSPNCSVKFVGKSTTPLRYAEQTFIRRGYAGDKFYIGLSSRADSVPAGGLYKVEVFFYNNLNVVVGSQALNFSIGTHDWETLSTTYTVPAAYYRVAFRFTYQNTAGTAWFDNAFLILVP